ncbi:MAG: 16S rRNA (cytosine(967)-C(5))-methyltransferase RsmB [Clostridiales bacterium]|nr:16S rRNA (cytosine(967)-C(5))-methyltransferase RsmB [Clostridiales bacterium]
MAGKNAREVALDALTAWQAGGVWSARKLSDAIVRAGLDKRDSAFATYLCGGVLQSLLLLDYHIGRHSSIKLNKLETRVLCILRLGAFQLLFSDSIPESAAVNETVALCRGKDRRSAGFVNAVLRALASVDDPYDINEKDHIKRISIRYSHPEWICRELVEMVGPDRAEEVLAANNEAPPVTIQVNTLMKSSREVADALRDEGVDTAPHEIVPNCLNLQHTGAIDRLGAFRQGWFWVQDASSMLAVMALDPKPGERILDVCAAPGGKSFAAAVLSCGKAEITSLDISERKLKLVREGSERMGLGLRVGKADATVYDPEYDGKFDRIICDVPCSGLGIIRKKPDIRYMDRERADRLPELQLNILKNVSRYLKPGGLLLYSTCTWRDPENAGVVKRFLGENREFELEGFELPQPLGHIDTGMITLWPQNFHFDGFFICLMRKNNV